MELASQEKPCRRQVWAKRLMPPGDKRGLSAAGPRLLQAKSHTPRRGLIGTRRFVVLDVSALTSNFFQYLEESPPQQQIGFLGLVLDLGLRQDG